MANGDYQSGLAGGLARVRAARGEAQNAVGEWSSFANKLEAQLLNETVERQVSVDYVRELRKALRELSPNHPLLNDQVATGFFERARKNAFNKQGYSFDPGSNRVTKLK